MCLASTCTFFNNNNKKNRRKDSKSGLIQFVKKTSYRFLSVRPSSPKSVQNPESFLKKRKSKMRLMRISKRYSSSSSAPPQPSPLPLPHSQFLSFFLFLNQTKGKQKWQPGLIFISTGRHILQTRILWRDASQMWFNAAATRQDAALFALGVRRIVYFDLQVWIARLEEEGWKSFPTLPTTTIAHLLKRFAAPEPWIQTSTV